MGKSTTPKYKLVIFDRGGQHVQAWQGRPTVKRLSDYIAGYIDSLKIGGCNQHISLTLGYIPVPHKAQICHNRQNGATVAEWVAPMFMAI